MQRPNLADLRYRRPSNRTFDVPLGEAEQLYSRTDRKRRRVVSPQQKLGRRRVVCLHAQSCLRNQQGDRRPNPRDFPFRLSDTTNDSIIRPKHTGSFLCDGNRIGHTWPKDLGQPLSMFRAEFQ